MDTEQADTNMPLDIGLENHNKLKRRSVTGHNKLHPIHHPSLFAKMQMQMNEGGVNG